MTDILYLIWSKMSQKESGTEIGNFEEIRFRRPTSAQLKLSGRQFEVADKANKVRINRIGL